MTKLLHPLGNRNRFLPEFVCKIGSSFLLLMLSIGALAQQTTLTGKILDERTKSAIQGANIRLKGSTTGTSTDESGSFSLKLKSLPSTLLVTSVLYKEQEIDVYEGGSTIIYLTEDLNRLQSIVVVGYGTQIRSELTGSVSSISSESLKQPICSFDNALQGKLAGVQVIQTSGQPGSATSLRIRGGNSIAGGNEPLYVIDGFPVYNDNNSINSGVVSGPSINALSAISPGDIESIDVLKDASATAIYGSRGANGVVIVTTKKGKTGRNEITYDSYYGIQKIIKKIPLLNATQWGLLKNDARVNAGKSLFYSEEQIANLGLGTDWQEEALREAPIQNHQLTIQGGDEKTRYSLSGNYYKQEGILLNTDFERFTGRLNFERKISENFKTGVTATASNISSNVANSSVVRALLLMPPTVNVKDAQGNYTVQSPFEVSLGNPIGTLTSETNFTNTYKLLSNAFGELRFFKDFVAKVTFGVDITNNKQNRYTPSTLLEGASVKGIASIGSKFTSSWLNENTITYNKILGNAHAINILAGYTQQELISEGAIASSQQFINDNLQYHDLGSGATAIIPSSSYSSWSLQSFLSRISYSYLQKYSFTGTIRADGSSRFGTNHKWGYFPSGAFAWNISKENFLKQFTFIEELKLRMSAGITGNQEIGQYLSLSTLKSTNYVFGNTLVTGFAPSRISNPDLGWEKTNQYDIGLDLGLYKNRIRVVVDAYYKRTSDLLVNVPIPYTTGQSGALQNFGTLDNRGFDFELSTENFKGKFEWNSSLVFSLNRNKVISLGTDVESIISSPSIVKVGEPLGSFYGYVTNGINQTTGEQQYKDTNGNETVTSEDRTVIGNAQPKFIGGLNNSFSYKNFDFTISIYGSYGNQLFNQNEQQLELLSGQQNASITALNRWTSTNPSNTIARAYENPAAIDNSNYVEDASYLRLKNLSLGYSIPLKSIVKNIRLYVTGQNLITLTKYSGYGPDVSKNEQSNIYQGIDYGVYPSAKAYTAGINITF